MSLTVNFFVQVAGLLEASLTVIVTDVSPRPTSVPAVGLWVMTREPAAVQLSEVIDPACEVGHRGLTAIVGGSGLIRRAAGDRRRGRVADGELLRAGRRVVGGVFDRNRHGRLAEADQRAGRGALGYDQGAGGRAIVRSDDPAL